MEHFDACCITCVRGQIAQNESARTVTNGRHSANWTGFIYDGNGKCDDALVADVLRRLNSGHPISTAAVELRGSYFLAIVDHETESVYSMVDDSGLYTAYRSSVGVSTSFLRLCQASGFTSGSFDRSAIIELLHLGNVYFGDTLSPDVKKIASNEIVVSRHSEVTVLRKPIARLNDPPTYESVLHATAALARALHSKVVSVDVTGGFDSRLLACVLASHGVQFECALAGAASTPDASLGRCVAEKLGRPFYFHEYDGAGLVGDLDRTLEQLDGMGGLIFVTHRLRQLNDTRIGRGVTVALKGSGGELYKEFFWTQDFPFYRSRKTRMARLNRLRIEFEQLTSTVLTDDAYREYLALRRSRCKRLDEAYTMPMNTQSYDNVYFYERVQTWNSRVITSAQDPRMAIHAPLCELKVAQLGFHAPRAKRFYNQFHRELITNIAPDVAKLTTTDGTTSSSNSIDMSLDSAQYVRDKGLKLVKKLSQLVLNKTRFVDKAHSPNEHLLGEISESALGQQSLQTMKDWGIIRGNITFRDVSPRFQEHLVAVGWTLNRLGETTNSS
jgi:asparagine synthetase B (glutamine-hydrolysing)